MEPDSVQQRDDLTETVSAARAMLAATPPSHPKRPGHLTSLLNRLMALYDLTWEQELLAEAIEHAREAVRLTPAEDRNLAGRISNLALCLHASCSLSGSRKELTEAISCARTALALTPSEHQDRPSRHNNLANHLGLRHSLTGSRRALMEAVKHARAAVALSPATDPDRPSFLNNLANHLGVLHALTGERPPLKEALRYAEEAVDLTPPGNPDRPTYLNTLGNQLRDWYILTSQREALEQAIDYAREAVLLTPVGRIDRPSHLHNLANHLGDWYALTDEEDVLAEAIAWEEDAIALTPDDHPDLPGFQNGLGLLLWARHMRTGKEADLREAIRWGRAAVAAMRATQRDWPTLVNSLGNHLGALYALTGEQDTLAEAIACGRKALSLTDPDHYDRPLWLYNLANHLSDWSRLTGTPESLAEAIELARESVACARNDLQNAPPTVLRTLYVSLAEHLMERDQSGDWEEARQHLQAALQQQFEELGRQRGERSGLDYLRDKEHVYRMLVRCCLELADRCERNGDLIGAGELRVQAWSAAEQGKGRLFAAVVAGRHEGQDLGLASLTAAQPVTYAELGASLPPNAKLIEFYPLTDDLVLFAVDRDSVRAKMAPLPLRQLQDWTYQLDAVVQTPAWRRAPRSAAAKVQALLANLAAVVAPVLSELLGQIPPARPVDPLPELILVPTGPLHRWPLHLLPWAGGVLWDAWVISYVPTADTLVYCAARRPEQQQPPVLLAPDPGLIGSFAEAALAELAGWKVAVGDAATPSALAGSRGNMALVTHVRAFPKQGGSSALRLWAGNDLTWVSAIDLLQLVRNRPPAEHGDLGACAAHYEEAGQGDHLQGLTRSFLRAGLRSLTTTLWPVDDLAACCIGARTRELMAGRGLTKAACLRQAALEFRAAGWAGAAAWLAQRTPPAGAGRKLLLALEAALLREAGDVAACLAVWTECEAAGETGGPYAVALRPLLTDLGHWAEQIRRAPGGTPMRTVSRPVTELHWGPSVLIGDAHYFAG